MNLMRRFHIISTHSAPISNNFNPSGRLFALTLCIANGDGACGGLDVVSGLEGLLLLVDLIVMRLFIHGGGCGRGASRGR